MLLYLFSGLCGLLGISYIFRNNLTILGLDLYTKFRYFSSDNNKNNKENLEKAENLFKELKKQNIDVLLDDVDENMSNKFKKHDLIGIPYQIIIGSKSENDKFEFKELNSQSEILSLDDIQLKLKK